MQRYARLAPLSGVVFFVLLVLGLLVLGGDTPDSDATTSKVVSFYTAHRGQQQAAALVLAVAGVFLLWFVVVLREELRARSSDGFGTAVLAGGIVMVTGYVAMAGSHFAVADAAHKVQPAAAQALNAADGATWMVSYAGTLFLTVALAAAVFRLALLPRAFGYVAIVLVVAMLTPIGWIAWLLMSLWLAIAGIVLARRAARPASVAPVAAAPAPA
jgi:hypothetical protein